MTAKETAAQVVGWLSRVVGCPGSEKHLEEALTPAENHVLMDGGVAIAWLAIMHVPMCGDVLDIAVHPDLHGKWLTRSVISDAKRLIFNERDFVVLENSTGKALKFALRMGANPIMIPGKKDTYLLSKASFKGGLQ